jgi:hypothetical protein
LSKSQSHEVIRDYPSSRGAGVTRSTTLEVCRSGEREIYKEWILVIDHWGLHVNISSTLGGSPAEGVGFES